MGKRTVHQVDAKAQLVVLATRSRVGLRQVDEGHSRAQLGLDPEAEAAALAAASGGKETSGLREEEDVFVAPVLISEDGQVGDKQVSPALCRFNSPVQPHIAGGPDGILLTHLVCPPPTPPCCSPGPTDARVPLQWA